MPHTTLGAVVLCLALLAASSGVAVAIQADDPCEVAMKRTQAFLRAEGSGISLREAILLVDAEVGSVCGFSIEDPTRFPNQQELPDPWDPDALCPPSATRSTGDGECERDEIAFPSGLDIPLSGEVPCTLPGEGPGTISVALLGVPLETFVAVGQWESIGNGVVEVAGEAALVGGIQAAAAGSMLVGPVPLPALGDSAATCVEKEVEIDANFGCIYLVFWFTCTANVVVEPKLIACRGTATQYLISPSILRYDHVYAAPACEAL